MHVPRAQDVADNFFMMITSIEQVCQQLTSRLNELPENRQRMLLPLAEYIQTKLNQKEPIRLVYICTHNSRRSHLGQIWSAVAADYFGIDNVQTYSGGTEATAFHPNAIRALQSDGFVVEKVLEGMNPIYRVEYAVGKEVECFSKVYHHPANPQRQFAAIMTCSDAEENCPFIPGVEFRIGTTYDDPKAADGTPHEAAVYKERSHQIALECLYVFSKVKSSLK
jgi:protein-tyrosine-phosphatase